MQPRNDIEPGIAFGELIITVVGRESDDWRQCPFRFDNRPLLLASWSRSPYTQVVKF